MVAGARVLKAQGAGNRLRVAVMGLGRGMAHVAGWLKVPGVEVVGLSEVDERRLAEGVKAVAAAGQTLVPRVERDFRRLLEDPGIDVLSIAAPNFWQTPAAVLACAAGKHVYVEKPGSHNGAEAVMLGRAAARWKRQVQLGTQRRSLEAMREGMERLRGGVIGAVRSARCWYDADRGAVRLAGGKPVPGWLDWGMWQGPCPERPYLDGLAHYKWHWRWHYGGGELANNGVHMLDLAMWGMGLTVPERVLCGGGRYHFQDDQETPDTVLLTARFADATVMLDSSSCHLRKGSDAHAFVTFYGDGGAMALSSSGYRVYDEAGKETGRNEPAFSDVPHFQNLADAIRYGKPLNAPIETGQRSALVCHLGNVAYRTGGVVDYDGAAGVMKGGPEVQALWGREYREGWQVRVD